MNGTDNWQGGPRATQGKDPATETSTFDKCKEVDGKCCIVSPLVPAGISGGTTMGTNGPDITIPGGLQKGQVKVSPGTSGLTAPSILSGGLDTADTK